MYCQNCRRDISENSNFCYFCGAHQAVAPQSQMPPKRLMRSATDLKIAGVCGGLAEYAGLDSTIVRLLWALVTFCTGIVPGLVVYLVAWVIMPVAPIYISAPAASAPSNAHQSAGPA